MNDVTSVPAVRTIEISPSRGAVFARIRELFEHRELLWCLLSRDIRVRYKQTVLGMGWALIQPVATTIIFSVVFGRLAKLPSNGVPYPLFSYTALLAWQFMAAGVARGSSSLVSNANLVTKVYFPRLLVPLAAALNGVLDSLVSVVLLVGMLLFYGVSPTWTVLTLPLFCLLALVTTYGIGLWLAVLNAEYRDIGQVTPFLIQIALYASPVAYSSQLIPERWRLLYALNPAAGVVEGFRFALLGGTSDIGWLIGPSTFTALLLLMSGTINFLRKEQNVADVI
jgi:homopolymeric O-antigen transport system permease protein